MTRLNLAGLLAALALALSVTAMSHASTVVKAPVVKQQLPPSGPFPDVLCTEDNPGDIYVGPDGMFWECVCELAASGNHICDWYDVPWGDRANERKKMRIAKKVIRVKRGVLYVPRVRPVI